MHKRKTFILFLLFLTSGICCYAQSVEMYFPKFTGKTYDFILFQGNDTKVIKGTIPYDGKFILVVPNELSPYTGMSRWLLTDSQEGGGLDMIIPGHDFAVECRSAVPDNKNIIYRNNNENSVLDFNYRQQQSIVQKFTSMAMITKVYPSSDKNYKFYEKELGIQKDLYGNFHKNLQKSDDYSSRFLKIVNLTKGMGRSLQENEENNKKEIVRTIVEEVSWNALYTSGHWDSVIGIFTELENKNNGGAAFIKDFIHIGSKLNARLYSSFAERVTYLLTKSGDNGMITKLSPVIRNSGKVNAYTGALAVYGNGVQGSKTPELVISSYNSDTNVQSPPALKKLKNSSSSVLKKIRRPPRPYVAPQK